jgi:hypothetical protein
MSEKALVQTGDAGLQQILNSPFSSFLVVLRILTLNRAAIEIYVAVRLGGIYDSARPTNRKEGGLTSCHRTVNPALLASSFVRQIQLYFLHISLFKIIKRKYFIQSKCEFMKLLFRLLGKIKILPLYSFYLPHQLLHMLFFSPFRNF